MCTMTVSFNVYSLMVLQKMLINVLYLYLSASSVLTRCIISIILQTIQIISEIDLQNMKHRIVNLLKAKCVK